MASHNFSLERGRGDIDLDITAKHRPNQKYSKNLWFVVKFRLAEKEFDIGVPSAHLGTSFKKKKKKKNRQRCHSNADVTLE